MVGLLELRLHLLIRLLRLLYVNVCDETLSTSRTTTLTQNTSKLPLPADPRRYSVGSSFPSKLFGPTCLHAERKYQSTFSTGTKYEGSFA